MAIELEAPGRPAAADAPQAANSRAELESWLFGALIIIASAFEATLIVLLRRLSLVRYPTVVPTPEPLATMLGINESALTWYLLAFGTLVLLQVLGYAVALRVRNPRYGLAAIAMSVVFIATMVPVYPGGAQDVFHNIADARTLWKYQDNPIVIPPAAHPDDPFTPVSDWQNITSSYGPVWYVVAGAPLPFTGDGLIRNVVGQKILVSLFFAGTLALVYLTVRRWRPHAATAAVVLLGWSPLLLWEIPGNAHNDVVMMFFAVAALYAVQRGRWQYAFPILAVAVATKFIVLAIVPLLLVWLLVPVQGLSLPVLGWRPRVIWQLVKSLWAQLLRGSHAGLKEVAIWFAIGATVFGLIYTPFLVSSATLMNRGALESRFISSPASLTIAFLLQHVSLATAFDYGRKLAVTCFMGGYVVVFLRCRGTYGALLSAAFWAVFLTLVFPTWWFWPWYLTWLLPLGALLAGRRSATVALVFTSSALLFYGMYYWRDVIGLGLNWYSNQVVLVGAVFMPVALYLLGAYGRSWITLGSQDDEPPEGAAAEMPAT